MAYFAPTRKKLFLLFSFLGIFNIVTAYAFFYFTSITILQERSTQQMSSIRAQASQKLSFYFENLKHSAAGAVDGIIISGKTYDSVLRKSLTGIYFDESDSSDSMTVLMGGPIQQKVFDQITQEMKFYPLNDEGFMLKISNMKGNLVFTFNFNGINEILMEYEGMGDTGEIYLVGQDNFILSASRHMNSGEPIMVDNASIELGKKETVGVHTVRDYRDKEVLSAFSPFGIDHLKYILLSEIDKSEVLSPLNSLFPKIFSLCLFLCFISVIIAYFLSFRILPYSQISER